jgi:cytochrome P450
VRHEVDSCRVNDADGYLKFDLDRLLRQPWLQAVYAESLRIRVNGFIVRDGRDYDLIINDWILPKNQTAVICSLSTHMDPETWKLHAQETPVDQFCPERFLEISASNPRIVKFSLNGREGAFVPYGGGSHHCPGRHFSKRQMMYTTALMVSLFDCEILADETALQMDTHKFGFGSLSPIGKVPVKLRRRTGVSSA